jgi:branched-subunit amino acid aminotransferase/4-amino-4-deoxychorismate lyase
MRLNGVPPTAEDLASLALYGYGHYTSFRVERDGVRGYSRHLARLAGDSARLFGRSGSTERIRTLVADYLSHRERPLLVRVTVFCRDFSLATPQQSAPTDVLVTSREVSAPPAPLRLRTVCMRRELPTVKHTGLAGQLRARADARETGADDALFVDDDGHVTEGATWNIGFFDGETLSWPDRPQLDGVSKQVLSKALAAQGVPSVHTRVSLADLDGYPAAFACNASWGVVPVAAIDDHTFDGSPIHRLARAYEEVAPEPV